MSIVVGGRRCIQLRLQQTFAHDTLTPALTVGCKYFEGGGGGNQLLITSAPVPGHVTHIFEVLQNRNQQGFLEVLFVFVG